MEEEKPEFREKCQHFFFQIFSKFDEEQWYAVPEDLFGILLKMFTAAGTGYSQQALFKMAGPVKRIEDKEEKYKKLDSVNTLIHDQE